MFRVPYRWLPRTVLPNLCSVASDISYGIYNLWRWLPVIWFDRDFDWAYLARITEIKFTRLSVCLEHGHHVNGPRQAKQALACAVLLRRLREDHYFQNAGYTPDGWKTLPTSRRDRIARHAERMAKTDQHYLGTLIGKHLTSFWD